MQITTTVGNYVYQRDERGWYHEIRAQNFRVHNSDENYIKEMTLTIGHPSKELAQALAEGRYFTITIDMPN